MSERKKILNEILVSLFNYILYIEEQNLKLKGVSLTINELHTLESIRETVEATITSVAKRLRITLSTMTTAIKKLEEKGYVNKERDKADARIVKLYLTKKANEVLTIHDEFHKHMIDHIISQLDIAEEEVLLRSLEKLQDYFYKAYPIE